MDTADDIVAEARIMLDDRVEPYQWDDDDLLRWCNEAQFEACLRMRLLVDSTTAAVCSIPLVAGQTSYTLHRSIIVARRIEFQPVTSGSLAFPLKRTTTEALDRQDIHWTSRTGAPEAVVQDLQQRTLRIDRVPAAADLGTLTLTVWRKPLDSEKLDFMAAEPVVPEEHRIPMAHWICARAFGVPDAELQDKDAEAKHYGLFEAHFGKRPSAHQLRSLATDDAGDVVAYHY